MWFRSLLESLARSPRRQKLRAADRRRQSRRLLLEGLEDRSLMAFNVLAEYAVGPTPNDLILAPMDADGQLDLITANGSGSSVTFLAGNGDGSFALPATTSATVASPRSVVSGDFDGDGAADLVTADNSSLSLLKGNGDGSFQPPVAISLPWQPIQGFPRAGFQPQYPSSVATGDLNHDGKLDLVVTGSTAYWYCPYGCYFYGDGYVNVLIGNGTGGFAVSAVHRLTQSPGPVAIEDLNHDGQGDLIVAIPGGLSVLLGDGTGAVGSPINSGSGSPLSSVSLGDLDGDGSLDTMLRSGYDLIVQKGQGDGRFVPSTRVNMGTSVDDAVVGDVNADGKLDLVAVSSEHTCTYAPYYCYEGYTTKKATVVLGKGGGSFSSPIASTLGIVDGAYDAAQYSSLTLADLTGDGRPELVAADSYADKVIVAEGNWPPADAPFINVDSATVIEGDAGTAEVSLTVSLSAPYSQTVTANFQTADVSASAGSDYDSSSGPLTFTPGETSHTITFLVHGDRLLEVDESFSVLLSSVVNANVGSVGSVTILDNEPHISIDHPYGIDPLWVAEGDVGTTPAVFTVSLAMPYDQEVTVDYYTLTGHTSDIISAAGTVRFAPGDTSETITVQVVGDLIDEPLEAFNVYLTNPSSNATIASGAGYCYIEDNDPSPQVTIGDVSKNEGQRNNTSFTFTVSLSAVSTNWVYVNFTTANGTATTGDNDYVAASGTVSIAPGSTSTKITVLVRGDKRSEANETFFVNLTGASGATIADSQGVGTILNDDGSGGGNGKSARTSLTAALLADDLLTTTRKRK